DLLVVVLLGTAVQNSLIGEDFSLLGGLLLAATLIGCNWVVGFVSARSERVEHAIQGGPVLLARDGTVFDQVLRAQNVSRNDLDEALRDHGLKDPSRAAMVTLEVDGTITVVPRKDDSG